MNEKMPSHVPSEVVSPIELLAAMPQAVIDLRDNHPVQKYTFGAVSIAPSEGVPADVVRELYGTTTPYVSGKFAEERRGEDGSRVIISRDSSGDVASVVATPPQ